MEQVQEIRELEKLVISDIKNVNSLITIKKHLHDINNQKNERIASLHSLRRIFLNFIENGKLTSSISGGRDKKREEFHQWLVQQYRSYQETLCTLISENDSFFQVPAIRTMLEFVRREHMISRNICNRSSPELSIGPIACSSLFGTRVYQSMLNALLSVHDIDFDVLVMLRDEVFSKVDCMFYTLLTIRNVITELKSSKGSGSRVVNADTSVVIKNCLDLIRFLEVPEEELLTDEESSLMPSILTGEKGDRDDDDIDGDAASSEENDGNSVPRLKQLVDGMKSRRGMKRVIDSTEGGGDNKKQKRLSRTQQTLDINFTNECSARLGLLCYLCPSQMHNTRLC